MAKLEESSARASVLSYFNDFTLRNGRDYFQSGQGLSFEFSPTRVAGRVSGAGRKYETGITFLNGGIARAECSCPIGYDCKHTATLLLAFRNAKERLDSTILGTTLPSDSFLHKFRDSKLASNPDSGVYEPAESAAVSDAAGATDMYRIRAQFDDVSYDETLKERLFASPMPADRFVREEEDPPPESIEPRVSGQPRVPELHVVPQSSFPAIGEIAPASDETRRVVHLFPERKHLHPVQSDGCKQHDRDDRSAPGQPNEAHIGEASYNEAASSSSKSNSSAELLHKLSTLARLCGAVEDHAAEKRLSDPSVRSKIVYIFENPNLSIATISAFIVSVGKGRRVGVPKPLRFEQLAYRPPTCAVPGDVEIGNLWWTISGFNLHKHDTLSEGDPALLSVLIRRIVGTGRAFFDSPSNPPLQQGIPLAGRLAWESIDGNRFRLTVMAQDGDTQHHCLRWLVPWYVDRGNWTCGPVEMEITDAALIAALSLPVITAEEAKSLPYLLAELGLSEIVPPPVSNFVQVEVVAPVPGLRFELAKKDLADADESDRVAVFSCTFPVVSNVPIICNNGVSLQRLDTRAPARLAKRLSQIGFESYFGETQSKENERCFWFPDHSRWVDFASTDIHLLRQEGWQIEADAERRLSPVELSEANINIKVSEGASLWFSLSLNVDINGASVPLLPLLMSAIRQLPATDYLVDAFDDLNRDGKFYTILGDGTLISLPFGRMRGFIVALQHILQRDHSAAALGASAPDLEHLLEDASLSKARWEGEARLRTFAEKMRRMQSIQPAPVPASLRTELRPYQRAGLDWLQFLATEQLGGILADDMGLGKTVQLLALVCLEKETGRLNQPILIVCPTSVLPNWISEARRFCPELKVVAYHGVDRDAVIPQFGDSDIVVSTYPIVGRDVEKLALFQWHGVVLDEAQVIKNARTNIASAVKHLKAGFRLCLTGTPVQNHLGELWSQFDFVLPGLLSDNATFKRTFRDPIEKSNDPARQALLAARVRPFVLRRTKHLVAAELPEKTLIVHKVELEGAQKDMYESVRAAVTKRIKDEIAKRGFMQSQFVVLEALLRLRQVCCDPQLIKIPGIRKTKDSAKLEALRSMLSQLVADGRRILLFSQFTSMLDLIKTELDKCKFSYVELRGDTKDRVTPIRKFQNREVSIFLISLKAGGTGLNLTSADVVIHYDPWWNPAVEDQATDRAHRIGQTKQVFVYRLIARGTIEERMLDLQQRKREIAETIYDKRGNVSLSFTEADLAVLLAPIDPL